MLVIRQCDDSDTGVIYEIINDAARAYKGATPEDRWHDPYMSYEELNLELEDGVVFWGLSENGHLVGVMGIQDRGAVTLIRHAYVRSDRRMEGLGSRLLRHLESISSKPTLVGKWADANWAIQFCQKNGYTLLSERQKNHLLRKYLRIPERQVETSVVLTNSELH